MSTPTLTNDIKGAIAAKVLAAFAASGFQSRAKYARSIKLNPSDFSHLENGKWRENQRLIGQTKWMAIANAVGFDFSARRAWATAPTTTYRAIRRQLEVCASDGLCAMFSDIPGIGKTHTAREFCATTPNAFYVHGGNAPGRAAFVRALATAMGLSADRSRTEDLLLQCISYLQSLPLPVVVVDEAGDLHDQTYLLIKRLYNELEFSCGLYMIGGPGLKKRIESALRNHRNGFAEVFSRFGGKFTTVVPAGEAQRRGFIRDQAILVAEANGLSDSERLSKVLSRDNLDLRAVRIEVAKNRIQKAA